MRNIALKIVFAGLLMSPCTSVADTDCRVIELPDHVELVCAGDPRFVTERAEPAADEQMNIYGAQVSRKRKSIDKIRTMNLHRFEDPSTLVTIPDNRSNEILTHPKERK